MKVLDIELPIIIAKKDYMVKNHPFYCKIKKDDDILKDCGVPFRLIQNLITEGVIDENIKSIKSKEIK